MHPDVRALSESEGVIACAHALCRCVEATFEANGALYCSEYCADSATDIPNMPSQLCGCGHGACVEPP